MKYKPGDTYRNGTVRLTYDPYEAQQSQFLFEHPWQIAVNGSVHWFRARTLQHGIAFVQSRYGITGKWKKSA